jgi:FkbM family methyltransferase
MYSQARIIGVEMDKANFDLAQSNTSHVNNNITMHMRAVSTNDSVVVQYDAAGHEDAFHISSTTSQDHAIAEVRSVSISKLFEISGVSRVDYVKMDIEGEEGSILHDPDLSWLHKVGQLQIELHPHLNPLATIELATAILENNDFRVIKSGLHARAIFAFNNRAPWKWSTLSAQAGKL